MAYAAMNILSIMIKQEGRGDYAMIRRTHI
jgi:hypothetical protein